MARKPKDSRRLEAKKKRRLKRLQRKSDGDFSGGESYSSMPLGLERMSDVLNEFVKPFLLQANSADEMQMFFSLGVMAWNTTLLPEPEQEAAIDDIIQKMGPASGTERSALRLLLTELTLRKKKYFASNRRVIAGFDFRETPDGYHLNVVSSLDLPERP